MNQVIAWVGFLGAWLLVAGPLYQGAIDLREEEVDREAIEATKADIPKPKTPSPWWWLLPPVMYYFYRRISHQYRQEVMNRLSPVQREQFTSFIGKAAGWLTVALGAACLAVGQTWEVVRHYRWPLWVFWVLIVVMSAWCLLNTTLRMRQDDRARAEGEEPVST